MGQLKDLLLDAIERKDLDYYPDSKSKEIFEAKLEAYSKACDDISELVRGILP